MFPQITQLLSDAYMSSLMMHSSVLYGFDFGMPFKIGGIQAAKRPSELMLRFRQHLIDNSEEFPPSLPHPFVMCPDPDLTNQGLTLTLAKSIHDWCRAGKRIWQVPGEESIDFDPAFLPAFTEPYTMLWFDEPAMGNGPNGLPVTCNLVLVEHREDYLLLRLFCNPIPNRQRPLFSYQEELGLIELLKKRGQGNVTLKTVQGKSIPVTQNREKASRFIGDSMKRTISYPCGHPGVIVASLEKEKATWLLIQHAYQSVRNAAMGKVFAWAKARLDSRLEPVSINHEPTKGRPISKTLPQVLRIFAPEQVFEIKRREVRTASTVKAGTYNTGTGRMVTVEHTRDAHTRTLYRGTPKERKIEVSEAKVVPKIQPGVAPGTLVVPRRRIKKPETGE